MKKILVLVLTAMCFAASAFALDFEVGVKGNFGNNVGDGQTAQDVVKNLDTSSDFQFGGSAYVHVSLLGLGVQIEPSIVKSTVNFSSSAFTETQTYDAMIFDLPVMLWGNINIWKLSVGAGAGVNISAEMKNNSSYFEQATTAIEDAIANPLCLGLVAGLDAKFYITDHIGIVTSARYIMDLTKRDVTVVVDGYDTGITYPTLEYARRYLYGSVGVEFKLF